MKPGKHTSEFYLTIASAVFGVLVALGLLTPEQPDQLIGAARTLVDAVIGLAAVVLPIIEYIKKRTELKKLEMEKAAG